ncbi:MAG: hypothetical protein E3J87_11445 [Candidatus Cloacimonadota bacterium]|nr:MAG: hypothetical protein E3J87_11445 [Candidatus Cloacimonadota bacterium]
MKKIPYYLLVISIPFILLSGCGEKVSSPPNPVPEISRLLEEGWQAYSNGNYVTAIAKFDTVIEIDASKTEAYIGKGWSSFRTGDFGAGLGLFSFAISSEGKSPAVPVYEETNIADTTWSESLWVSPNDIDSVALITTHFLPIMGMLDTIVTWDFVYIDTSLTSPETTYLSLTSSIVSFSEQNILTTVPLDIDTLDSIPPVLDSVSITYSYVYLDTTTPVTVFQKDAYAGESGIYKASNDENKAIFSAATVIFSDSTYSFSVDAANEQYATAKNLHILLARSYYNVKLFYNAVDEVLFLDPTWVYYPFAPQFLYELAKKIEELEG